MTWAGPQHIVRLPQQAANNHAAMQTREALQTLGEEAIFLLMFHEGIDGDVQPRCDCYDEDYAQTDTFTCGQCYGTTFKDGVKAFGRVWAIFGDAVGDEHIRQRGQFIPDKRTVQLEEFPVPHRHDYIVRVRQWDNNHAPISLGERYVISQINEVSVRTGIRYGQQPTYDVMGQRSDVSAVDEKHPIMSYEIPLGQTVKRFDEFLQYGFGSYGFGPYEGGS